MHGKPLQFVERKFSEDNDCGFHGLNLDRNSAIQQLLRFKDTLEIRALVAPEIKATFIEGNIPLSMRGAWYHRLHQVYHQGTPSSEVAQELDTYSNDPTNYSFFIREYLGGGGWLSYQLNATSTMDALAKLNNLTVHIWQPSPQKHALKCIYSTKPYGEKHGEKNTIHLFHTHKETHYNRLEVMQAPAALSDFSFDSQISLFAIKEMLPQIKNPDSFLQNLSAKMKEHYAGKEDAEREQWQKSFDQMRSTLLSENQGLKNTTHQSLLHTPQDFQVKTSDIDTKNYFYTGLSLDGGGIRGLVPAVMLRDFQQEARNYKNNIHVHEMFDYIGGTSVGGILALGLTAPHEKIPTQPLKTLDEMVDLFKNEGSTIFQRTGWGSYMPGHDLFKPKFTPQGLETFLETNFKDLPLSTSLTPIVVTAVNHTQAPLEGFLFDTSMARLHPDHNFLMRDVGRATSAAQTYFPEACIWNLQKTASYKFSDGGPWLNNPSGVVYNKVLKNFPHASHKNIMMVSLGTGEAKPEYSVPSTTGIKGQGPIGWMKPLIFGQMNLNVFGVDLAMQETLGTNYIRLQPKIVDQSGALKEADLADYTPQLLDEYMALASQEFDTYIKANESFIRNLIEKRAQRKDPF